MIWFAYLHDFILFAFDFMILHCLICYDYLLDWICIAIFDYLLGLFVCNDFIWILFCILLMILFALLNHFVGISVLFISIMSCFFFEFAFIYFLFCMYWYVPHLLFIMHVLRIIFPYSNIRTWIYWNYLQQLFIFLYLNYVGDIFSMLSWFGDSNCSKCNEF